MGLDAPVELMIDGADGEVVLEFFECLLDLGEADVVLPQGGGVFVGQVGAQHIATFAPAHGAQLVAAQGEGEGVCGDGLFGVDEFSDWSNGFDDLDGEVWDEQFALFEADDDRREGKFDEGGSRYD